MKQLAKRVVFGMASTAVLNAAGYRLPEQSLNSVALSAAYVAHAAGADAAYFNPANMAFMEPDSQYVEGALTVIHLPSIDYEGVQYLPPATVVGASGSSKTENIPVAQLHYVSSGFGNWHFGFSVVAPGGLSKRWNYPVQKLFAEEFTLKIVEVNPSFAYRINEQLSVGGGLRLVYADGTVKSDGSDLGILLKRDMDGDVVAFGYNLALAWHPAPDWQLAVTYRSKVDLDVEGNAKIYAGSLAVPIYDGRAEVSIPLPASLNIAVAKTFDERLTVELVYERNFWSAYKELDFKYDASLPVFDDSIEKSWKDTNTFRLGLSYLCNERLTLMTGYAYDESPAPARTLGYELPDSDAQLFSAGFRYRQTDNFEWGMALLYDSKKKRAASVTENENGIDGIFEKGGAFLSTVGFKYRF
jgi:long-chain fatty acid transport protein